MTQTVMVGTDGQVQTGLYGGVAPTTYEEGGTNGFGVRMTPMRYYHNWFTQAFTGADVGFFNSGHLIAVSVSNPYVSPGPSNFTHRKLAAGTYGTAVDAMWDRIAALPFDAAVAGGSAYGGLNQAQVVFIYNHEEDAKGPDGTVGKLYYDNGWTKGSTSNGTKDTAADFISAWKYLWNRWVARAANAGVPTSRVRFCWNMTAYGFTPDRVTQYWPGGTYVDEVGADCYWNPGLSFTSAISGARAFCVAHNKPMSMPEFNYLDGTTADSSSRAAQFTGAATTIANETAFNYSWLSIWVAPDNTQYNFNKVAGASASGKSFPLIHAGIQTMIATLGGNPIRSAVTQADPSAPSILSCVSNSAGTQITITWDNNPSGDNVTGWDVYLALGTTTSLPRINTTSDLSAATRSYTYTALVDGTAIVPGGTYSAAVVAVNGGTPLGRSGYSAIQHLTTTKPGPTSNAPVITGQTAAVDGTISTQIDFTVTATSPLSLPLTYTHVITGPSGFTTTLTGSAVTVGNAAAGAYSDAVTVSDNATPPNTTPVTLTFSMPVAGGTVTPNIGLVQIQPGFKVNVDLGPNLRGNNLILDTAIGNLQVAKSPHNLVHGLVASTFDPASCGSAVFTSASGNLIWAALAVEDDAINGITLITGTAQAGTGSQLGIHDANGALLTDTAGNVCSYGTTSVQTSVAVDTWLQTAFTPPVTPPILNLPASITVAPQTVVYVSLFFPSGLSTYPTIRCSSAGSVEACVNLSTQPAYGLATGQTVIVDPIPFSSWSSSALPVFIGLF